MIVERLDLEPGFSISRIIKGGWQLSHGHSQQPVADPIADMFAFAEAGITTFDCADIYTGVEELIGKFLTERKKRMGSNADIQVFTKFVPDYDALPTLNKRYAERIVDRSLKRLGVERLDMVQLSWWNYEVPGWVEAANWLKDFQQAGKIRLVSGTNFNTEATRQIVESGVRLSSLQVQFSVIDNRPEKELTQLCAKHGIYLLCYGSVAGGFLSERWLDKEEPRPPFENRSLIKYRLMIDEFGGWDIYQELLNSLHGVAQKHGTSLANVVIRYILDRPQVGGAIVGARTGTHLQEIAASTGLKLDHQDLKQIGDVLKKRMGPSGDVFDLERIKDGPHGSIMRYNLNQLS